MFSGAVFPGTQQKEVDIDFGCLARLYHKPIRESILSEFNLDRESIPPREVNPELPFLHEPFE